MHLLRLPSVAENIENMTIASWLVDEGAEIKPGDVIAEIITEKAEFSYEIEEGIFGTLLARFAKAGSTLPVGYIIAVVGEEAERETALSDASRENEDMLAKLKNATYDFDLGLKDKAENKKSSADRKVRATPAARRVANEANLKLTDIADALSITGIIKEDDVTEYIGKQK